MYMHVAGHGEAMRSRRRCAPPAGRVRRRWSRRRPPATRTLSITIDPPPPLVITNPSAELPPGTVGVPYATSRFADGGVPPYKWAIVAGHLPPGIALNSSNVLSGTPKAAGTFTFTARVTDTKGVQASREFSITVS